VDGFEVGIKVAKFDYGITFQEVRLTGQGLTGIHNTDNALFIRGLTSSNTVPVVQNPGPNGLVVLLDGQFEGDAPDIPAIQNQGGLYARSISAPGYSHVVQDRDQAVGGHEISEYFSGVHSLFSSVEGSLGLEVVDPPEVPAEPAADWANVVDFGATPEEMYDNDTAALKAALDSGASTIFLPNGWYQVDSTLVVDGQVSRIVTAGARISATWDNDFAQPAPLFDVQDGVSPAVEIAGIYSWDAYSDPAQPEYHMYGIRHDSWQTLVVRDWCWGGYRSSVNAGDVFFENVVFSGPERDCAFDHPQRAWAWHFNIEADFSVVNSAADLWILGFKTEGARTILETTGSGRSEVLGGLFYPVREVPPDLPAFVNQDASLSLVYVTTSYQAGRDYTVHVRETRDAETRELTAADLDNRGLGSLVPLYSGHVADPEPDGGLDGGEPGDDGADEGELDSDGGDAEEPAGDDGGPEDDGGMPSDPDPTGDDTPAGDDGPSDEADGVEESGGSCGCSSQGAGSGSWLGLLLLVLLLRFRDRQHLS
jgi:MYXO-CTERM domain-containing protein